MPLTAEKQQWLLQSKQSKQSLFWQLTLLWLLKINNPPKGIPCRPRAIRQLSDYPSLGVRVCTFQQQWLLGFNLCCQWRVIVWLKPRPKRTRNSGTLSPAGLQSRSSFNLVLFHSLCPTGLTAWLLAADAALSGVFAGLLRPRRKSRARGPDQTATKFGPAVRPGSNLGAASHWKIDGSCCPSIKTSYSLL